VRETLHIADDKQRIALVETRTEGNDPAPERLIRYQFGNHLGSATLEMDHHARIISFEEYTPYGSTSYQAVRSQTETPKRYRYTGKERDEETGLYYYGARYYAPWLARWTTCDPVREGGNPYVFVTNNPVRYADPDGKDEKQPTATGSYTTPNNRGDLGTLIHKLVLTTIQLRLAALDVPSATEVPTLPDGSKNMGTTHSGRVDLAILLADSNKPGSYKADVYDLKPHKVDAYSDYQTEVHHYTEHFPPTVSGLPISSARIGEGLRIVEKFAPQVFDPIKISYGGAEVTISPSLARDANNRIVPGLLTYDIGLRNKRPGEDDNVERVKGMLKTSINQTADAQAHGIVRASFIAGGVVNTLDAIAQLSLLAGSLFVGIGGGGAIGVGGVSASGGAGAGAAGVGAGTATATVAGVRIAVPTLYRIAGATGMRVAGVRIATGVGEAIQNEAIAEDLIETGTEIVKKLVMTVPK
jgi:RHS repeat-associated protein